MMSNYKWEIFRVLPNFTCSNSFENEFVSICPSSDKLVVEFSSSHPEVKPLLNNFNDPFGNKREISAFIVRVDAPSSVKNFEYLINFRNVVAISVLLHSCQEKIRNIHLPSPVFNDFFYLYPVVFRPDAPMNIVIDTPSVRGSRDSRDLENFQGQVTPGIQEVFVDRGDDYIFSSLLKLLKRKTYKRSWELNIVFRSLEVAFQAGLMPNSNEMSIHDFGLKISLWVSALEVLTHPRNSSANFLSVKRIFDQANWCQKRLKRKGCIVQYKNQRYRVDIVVKVLKELYDARNDFLHGNPVSEARVFPFRNKNLRPLTQLAPLIYRFALGRVLSRFGANFEPFTDTNPFSENYFLQENYENAFFKGLKR